MKLLQTITTALLAFHASAIKPRDFAPDFEHVNAVMGHEMTKVSLNDFKDKWVVMLFYPFDFTYVCPTELIAFSDELD